MTKPGRVKTLSPVMDPAHCRVAFAAASILLRYPDESLLEDLPLVVGATGGLSSMTRSQFAALTDHLASRCLLDLQSEYVATFDLKRRCCLYLSYYLNGDTRRRGMALWQFQEAFRLAGFHVLGGELPDFIPALLELAATEGRETAIELLQQHRAGIRVLLAALDDLSSPYAGVVRAIDSLLPAPVPGAIANALLLAREGPPTELVGVEPREAFDPYGSSGTCTTCVSGAAPGSGLVHLTGRRSS